MGKRKSEGSPNIAILRAHDLFCDDAQPKQLPRVEEVDIHLVAEEDGTSIGPTMNGDASPRDRELRLHLVEKACCAPVASDIAMRRTLKPAFPILGEVLDGEEALSDSSGCG